MRALEKPSLLESGTNKGHLKMSNGSEPELIKSMVDLVEKLLQCILAFVDPSIKII